MKESLNFEKENGPSLAELFENFSGAEAAFCEEAYKKAEGTEAKSGAIARIKLFGLTTEEAAKVVAEKLEEQTA